MKRKIIILAIMSAFAISACSNGAIFDKETTETTKAVEKVAMAEETSAAMNSQTKPSTETIDINTILGMLGKKDADVIAVMGEGTPTINQEKVLNAREYDLPLFGEDTITSMVFNQYQYGNDILEMCTIQLNKNELEGYRDELTKLLGKPSETHEKSYFYETDEAIIVLANPYDLPYIEITLKQDMEP